MRKLIIIPGLLVAFAALGSSPLGAKDNPAKFAVAVFNNETCAGQAAGKIDVDASKPCVNYSYADSKGKITHGSLGNFRCYPDKLVLDKFPFASDCDPSAKLINRDYSIQGSSEKCQTAPSHEGTVSERLLGYRYPGNEACGRK